MKRLFTFLLLLLPVITTAQSGLNLTGRISFRTVFTDYDQISKIKPDSIPDDQYAKTTTIPGLSQALNIALFARTRNADITLLSEIRNNPWNKLNSLQNVDRFTLSARFESTEIVLGDFFDSGSEFFIQSREVRGAKVQMKQTNLWSKTSYLNTKIDGGQIQQAHGIGTRLRDVYHQYENAGQFRRYFASAVVHAGDSRYYDVGLKYLYAKDDAKSVNQSINEPLTNQNFGGSVAAFLWDRKLQLFGEGYLSRKDTLSASGISDNAYKAGMDLRIGNFKFLALYQRLGYDYFSAGYPFLQNDRQGFKLTSGYYFPSLASFIFEGEQFEDNQNKDPLTPTTKTRLMETGFVTHFKHLPEFSLKFRFRDDNSNVIMDTIKTEKITRGIEASMAFSFNSNRISLSTIYLDLNDHSVLISGKPLGTEQFIGSLNFYLRPVDGMFLSGGSVFSTLRMTNEQENKNIYAYISGRWDIIARTLKLETTANYIFNDAANGGTQDMLSDYARFGVDFSIEYFFNSNISFKLIGGSDSRNMRYTAAEAQQIVANDEYGPLFFNGSESFKAMKYGAEINWIF